MKWHPERLDQAIDTAEFVNCETWQEAVSLRTALRRRLRRRDIAHITTSIRGATVWLHRRPTITLSSELT